MCAYVTRNDMTAFAYKSKLPLECVDFGTSTSNSSSGLGNGKKKSNVGNSNNDSLRFMTDSFIKSITEVEKSPQISRVRFSIVKLFQFLETSSVLSAWILMMYVCMYVIFLNELESS